MNKLFSKIAALSVGLAMAVGVGVAVNAGSSKVEEVKAAAPYDFEGDTVVFANQSLTNGEQYLDPFSNGSFSVQFAGGTNDGKYYNTGAGMRIYGGGHFTVTGISGNVTSLTFAWDTNASYKPSSTDVVDSGTLSSDYLTWTGDAETVTLSRPSGSGHWRLKSVQAVLKSGGEAKITLSKTAVTFLSTDEGLDVSVNAVNFGGTPTLSLSSTPTYVNIAFDGLGFSVSPKAVGTETVTIVATYNTTVASAELSVVVNDPHGRIPDDPFTVSEVIAALDAGLSSSEYVYVTGIISEVTKLQDGQMTYWIGANQSTKSFEVYKGKNVGNVNFQNLTDLEVGGTVVVYGTTQIYSGQSTVYEFNAGNYLISYVAPVVERTLVSIEVSGQKTDYNVGDEFVKPVVTAHYDDEYSKPVTDSAVFSGYDLSVAGEQTVEVSYTEDEVTKETSYTITVTAPVTATYRRLTVSLVDYTGDYLIVCEDLESPVAFDGSLDTLDAANNNVVVEINDDSIELADTHEFHVAKKDSGFSIQSDSGKYIGKTADSNGLDENTSNNYTNSISFKDGVMNVVGEGTAVMRFNATSGQNRFRFFKSSTYTSQKAISLFMKVSPAESLALDILNDTNATCAAYIDGETHYDKTTFADVWTALALKYNALDPEDQAVLIDADANKNGVMLEEAMARYDFLCAKYGLDNFMTGRVLSYAITAPQFSVEVNNSNMMIIIVAISSVTVLSLGVLIVLKKRKHN